jgi:hypothetical protein
MPPIAAWRNHLRAEGINSLGVSHRTVLWGLFHALSGDSGGLPTGKNAQNAMVR